jgi:hypothetical protein
MQGSGGSGPPVELLEPEPVVVEGPEPVGEDPVV